MHPNEILARREIDLINAEDLKPWTISTLTTSLSTIQARIRWRVRIPSRSS
jgi:hypothetical protein